MKILHIISSLEIGGAQRLLSDLLPLFKQKGINVDLLVYNRNNNAFENKIANSGINIISLKTNNYRNPIIILKLRRIIKEYDIIHVHLFPSLYQVAFSAIGSKTKLIFTEHNTYNKRRKFLIFKYIERFIYERYCKVISINAETQESLLLWLDKPNYGKFIYINNGVDIKKFKNIRHINKDKTLIMISRFSEQKDQETLIKAFPFVKNDSVKLVFVGDGPKINGCKHLVHELGLSKRIFFLGTRFDIPKLLAKSYIGIQSSKWEGFGLTAVEIMASGIPIIASSVEGLKQVVEGAGLLFEPGNIEELASQINLLLDNNNYYMTITKQCVERASDYDIEEMANQYNEVYKIVSEA